MGRRKKTEVVENTAQEPKVYAYGDLVIFCKCGHMHTLERGIQNGIQIVLVTREDSGVHLTCDGCGSDMWLKFVEGQAPEPTAEASTVTSPSTESTVTTDENIQKEDKQEESI